MCWVRLDVTRDTPTASHGGKVAVGENKSPFVLQSPITQPKEPTCLSSGAGGADGEEGRAAAGALCLGSSACHCCLSAQGPSRQRCPLLPLPSPAAFPKARGRAVGLLPVLEPAVVCPVLPGALQLAFPPLVVESEGRIDSFPDGSL